MLHYLIDGYNVIRQISFLSDKTLRGEREGLIRFIEQKKPQGKNEITIVFDGQKGVSSPSLPNNEVRIIFTKGISADEKIKKIVEKSDAKQMVVVSDDKEIKFCVRNLGAKVLSVKEFIEKGFPNRRPTGKKMISPQEKKLPPQTREITEELEKLWLKQSSL